MLRMISLFAEIVDSSKEQQVEGLIHGQVELLCGVIMISSNAHMFSFLPIKATTAAPMEQILTQPVPIFHFAFVSSMPTSEHMVMMFVSFRINPHIQRSIFHIVSLRLKATVYNIICRPIIVAGSPRITLIPS